MRRHPPLALAYHGVARVPLRDDRHGLFTDPRALRSHIGRLRAWGYRLVTFGELAAEAAAGRGAGLAALTFDDGLADNLHELVPVLREEQAPATVFVIAGLLGEPHPDYGGARLLDPSELRELARAVEIGSHSVHHLDLTSVSVDVARRELAESRRCLGEITGAPVDVLSYPFGCVNEAVMEAAREAGYRAAAGVSGQGAWDEPMYLPRQDMTNGGTMLSLRLKRDNRYEPLMRFRVVRLARAMRRRIAAAL
ncbi:MAG TPA: polysaccharide deacetylase family protein [Acidimicrobiales bacterium]|nr:polysaccharide deacetylase family protein [Acidimicrobiales bacterium]